MGAWSGIFVFTILWFLWCLYVCDWLCFYCLLMIAFGDWRTEGKFTFIFKMSAVGVLVSDPWLQSQFTQVELRTLQSKVLDFSLISYNVLAFDCCHYAYCFCSFCGIDQPECMSLTDCNCFMVDLFTVQFFKISIWARYCVGLASRICKTKGYQWIVQWGWSQGCIRGFISRCNSWDRFWIFP